MPPCGAGGGASEAAQGMGQDAASARMRSTLGATSARSPRRRIKVCLPCSAKPGDLCHTVLAAWQALESCKRIPSRAVSFAPLSLRAWQAAM